MPAGPGRAEIWTQGEAGLGRAALGGWPRFPGEPDSQPSSHLSPLLLAQRVLAAGNRMVPSCPRGPTVLVSRGDCAKAVISRAKPQEACKRDLG